RPPASSRAVRVYERWMATVAAVSVAGVLAPSQRPWYCARVSMAEGGFPDEAFDRLAALERGNYWFESRNRLIVWAMRRYFPGASTFLEVGCGTGFVLQGLHAALPGLRLTATDAAGGGLEIARARVPAASFVQQDARALDAHQAFDVV